MSTDMIIGAVIMIVILLHRPIWYLLMQMFVCRFRGHVPQIRFILFFTYPCCKRCGKDLSHSAKK